MIPYNWTQISSDKISKVKYLPNEHDLRGDMLVEFRTGKVYKFSDVPQHKVERMVHASSPGTYFAENIRGEHKSEALLP